MATDPGEARSARSALIQHLLKDVTTPTDEPFALDVNEARAGLREGIENSREIVRQSLMLIELAESEGVFTPADDETAAN